jgi:hypothetical protein
MRSNAGRALLGAALVVAAVVLFLVLQDDGGNDAPSTGGGNTKAKAQSNDGEGGAPAKSRKSSLPKIQIRDGKPVGGVETLEFVAGERIEFAVDSNVADEIHVHGYDVEEEVGAGGTARFDFPATIEGVFEVELHHSGEQIAELRVNP